MCVCVCAATAMKCCDEMSPIIHAQFLFSGTILTGNNKPTRCPRILGPTHAHGALHSAGLLFTSRAPHSSLAAPPQLQHCCQRKEDRPVAPAAPAQISFRAIRSRGEGEKVSKPIQPNQLKSNQCGAHSHRHHPRQDTQNFPPSPRPRRRCRR